MEPMQEPMQEPPATNGMPEDEPSPGGDQIIEEVNAFHEPFHLLRPSSDHRSLVADPAAMRRLEALGPMTVLAVVGNQRGGKSTLMNLLHGRRLHGFQMGHYMDPQTYGLWAWPKPHPRQPGKSILLVDSEGLDSPHVPQHYNWLISAVTLLMSDVFMYQTKGSIEQSAADRLDMILKVAEQLGKSGGGGDGDGKGHKGGNFIWLLRDHQLQMKRTPREELIEMLEPAQVRLLRRSFEDFDCVPLPRPAKDELLKNLDQQKWEDLSSDFREEFVVFERRLLQLLAEPREFFGGSMTGAGLAEVLTQYINAIQQQKGVLGDICQMPTQRELLKQLAGRRASKAGTDKYQQQLSKAGLQGDGSRLPVLPAELFAGHDVAREAALQACRGEAATAGLEEDEIAEIMTLLEEQLARWDHSAELADEGFPLRHDDTAAEVCSTPAMPSIVRVARLRGGLLWELWSENARHSRAGYEAWLAKFREPQEEALLTLEDYYAQLKDALANVNEDCQLGPWAALHGFGIAGQQQRRLLLDTIRTADQLILARVEKLESKTREAFQRADARIEEQAIEHHAATDKVQCAVEAAVEQQRQESSALREALAAGQSRSAEDVAALREDMAAGRAAAVEEQQRERRALDGRLCGLDAAVSEAAKGTETRLAQIEERATQAVASASTALQAELRTAEERMAQRVDSALAELGEELRGRAAEATLAAERAMARADAESAERCAALDARDISSREAVEAAAEKARTISEAVTDLEASHKRLREEQKEQLNKHKHKAASDMARMSDTLVQLEANCNRSLENARTSWQENAEAAKLAAETWQQKLEAQYKELEEQLHRALRQAAEERSSTAGLEEQLKTAMAPLQQQLDAASSLMSEAEKRLMSQLDRRLSEAAEATEIRQEAHIARSLQRNEQRMEQRVVELRQNLAREREEVNSNLASFRQNMAVNTEERRKITDFMASADLDSLWESFAMVTSRLSEVQCQLDDFMFRHDSGCLKSGPK